MSLAPTRRFSFKLELDADTREDVLQALRKLSFEIVAERLTTCVSGGYNSGYVCELKENPEMDHDTFVAQLEAWIEVDRARKQTTGTLPSH